MTKLWLNSGGTAVIWDGTNPIDCATCPCGSPTPGSDCTRCPTTGTTPAKIRIRIPVGAITNAGCSKCTLLNGNSYDLVQDSGTNYESASTHCYYGLDTGLTDNCTGFGLTIIMYAWFYASGGHTHLALEIRDLDSHFLTTWDADLGASPSSCMISDLELVSQNPTGIDCDYPGNVFATAV